MGSKLHCDMERLDLSSRPFLEKSVEHMVDGIEALRQDQERAEYRKRDAERCWPPPLPVACVCVMTLRCHGGATRPSTGHHGARQPSLANASRLCVLACLVRFWGGVGDGDMTGGARTRDATRLKSCPRRSSPRCTRTLRASRAC